jgi:hypothetical protein
MRPIEDELAEARMLLDRFNSGDAWMLIRGIDVTQREIAILRREIAFYEKVLARKRP